MATVAGEANRKNYIPYTGMGAHVGILEDVRGG